MIRFGRDLATEAGMVTRKERNMMVRNNWGPLKSSTPKAAVTFLILVAEWPRNEREMLRIMLSKYNGRISVDVRIWFCVEGGEFRPSRRGISLRLTEISDIRKGLRKARETGVGLALLWQIYSRCFSSLIQDRQYGHR